MNAIKKRIWELARFELGWRKKFIRKVRRKEIIPNKRYAWLLYSGENPSETVDTVVLDVNLAEALAIDRDLGVEVDPISKASSPSGITVLLADDHAVLRQGIRSLLEAEDDILVVGEAENGQQAVQMAERIHPDIVLMDIAMPSLNGLEATRLIKAQHLKSKVLILSCHGDEDYVKRSIDAGAVGYLIKQSTAHDLIRAIREARKGNAFFSQTLRLKEKSGTSPQSRSGAAPQNPGLDRPRG